MTTNATHCRAARLLLACGLLAGTGLSQADAGVGREIPLRGHDLVVNVDTRWAGCAYGGYFPIRVRIVNRGPSRTLGLRFAPGEHDPLPVVETRVDSPQNSTVDVTLPVPMVGVGATGDFLVLSEGRPLKEMRTSLALPSPDRSGGVPRPSLLIVSAGVVDGGNFEAGVNATFFPHQEGALGHHYGGGLGEDHQVVPPRSLPAEWIHYSGLDLVAVPLSILAGLDPERREALVDWVETGGTLLVTEVGSEPGESGQLDRLLGVDRRGAASPEWQHLLTTEEDTEDAAGAVFARDLMLGRVATVENDPFPGQPETWSAILQSVMRREHHLLGDATGRQQWPMRHGVSARWGTSEFPEFLIPGVRSVPVNSVLALITMFTIVIGPLNYFLLWKRRQLNALILTIPVIAVVTSVALFAYSAMAHGFHTRSRVRSVTILDERDHSAVTVSRNALFAGMAPSDGLKFSPQTAVYTIWPEGQLFQDAHVDWTETQHFDEGWLRSRTRTQFLTVRNHTERGRLEVLPGEGNSTRVANGFEFDIAYLLVKDADGNLLSAEDVVAGDTATLAPTDSRSRLLERLTEHPLRVPDGMARGRSDHWFGGSGRGYGPHGWGEEHTGVYTRYANSSPELLLRHAPTGDFLPPNSYVAVLAENPGVDTGVESAREEASLHVLFGFR